jgi:Uncharacterized conserved protein
LNKDKRRKNMPIKEVISTERVPVKIWTDEVDEQSKQQLRNIASLPFVHHHVAAMPDVHLGIGATIGSVIATHKAIRSGGPSGSISAVACLPAASRSPPTNLTKVAEKGL